MAKSPETCMFCGDIPCTCNAKPAKVARPKRPAAPASVPVPVTAPVARVNRPARTKDDIIEIVALQNLASMMTPDDREHYKMQIDTVLTPAERLQAWGVMK